MWVGAADSGDLATALIPAVWTFLGIVVVTLGTIFVQSMKGRSDRDTTSTPAVAPSSNGTTHLLALAKDIGQLDERANDNDDRDDLQDRRHDKSDRRHERTEADAELLMRWAKHHDPEWWR